MPDATPLPLSRDTVVVASESQVSAALDAEAVILSMHDGMYYGLDGVGARVWELLRAPVSLAQLTATIVEEYEVDDARAFADLVTLVTELEGRALVSRVTTPPRG